MNRTKLLLLSSFNSLLILIFFQKRYIIRNDFVVFLVFVGQELSLLSSSYPCSVVSLVILITFFRKGTL